MYRSAFVGLVVFVAAVSLSGAEFSLAYKTIPVEGALGFPGVRGSYGQFQAAKPTSLKKEPKAVSSKARYGTMYETPQMVYRIDESKGTGKGYDELIIDLNCNGDLTDDSKAGLATGFKSQAPPQGPMIMLLFGPFQGPEGKCVLGKAPLYYANVYLRNPNTEAESGLQGFLGQLSLRPGFYLETTIELGGKPLKFGIVDGNCNLRFGDAVKSQTYESGNNEQGWYVEPGDCFLVDADNSGDFKSDFANSEASAFGPLVYIGPVPYKVSLKSDLTAVTLTRYADELAEVSLKPQGDCVQRIQMALAEGDDRWQLLNVPVQDGKVRLPEGKYRPFTCILARNGEGERCTMASGHQSKLTPLIQFEAGKPNALVLGGPLEVKVTAEKRIPQPWDPEPGTDSSDVILSINGRVTGKAGEVYSSFNNGRDSNSQPAHPTFDVTDANGKQIAKGKLEFG